MRTPKALQLYNVNVYQQVVVDGVKRQHLQQVLAYGKPFTLARSIKRTWEVSHKETRSFYCKLVKH